MNVSDEIKQAWEDVKDDHKNTNFLILSKGSDQNPEILAQGEGGYEEYTSHLKEDNICFGGMRVFAIDDKHDAKRAKFIYVAWIGSKVGGLKKGRAGMDNKNFEPIFTGAHMSLQVSELGELSKDVIVERLQQIQGSHKPTGYEW